MAINPEALLALKIPDTIASYGPRDCVLYALGVGAGMNPTDTWQLSLIDLSEPRILPTLATVLAYQGFWVEQLATGIDVTQVLHVEQRVHLQQALPSAATIRRITRVTGIVDRGPDRGALVYSEQLVSDVASGAIYARLTSTILCRADGGCGGTPVSAAAPCPLPVRPPDASVLVPTSPQQALIYSLSGDTNPLHTDPVAARAAGFSQPILHGLASFGTACMALTQGLSVDGPVCFREFGARFTNPVFPGDTLAVDYWNDQPGVAAFRVRVPERGVTVMNNGRLSFARET